MRFKRKPRTFAQMSSYANAGIRQYRIEEVLDEHMTPTCRSLHGKVLSVGDALNVAARPDTQAGPSRRHPNHSTATPDFVNRSSGESGLRWASRS